MATIGTWPPVLLFPFADLHVASRPSISGICTSISTTSNGSVLDRLDGVAAIVRPR